DLNPTDDDTYTKWGIAICNLAILISDENLYRSGFEKYRLATELNPNNSVAYNNWGVAICYLAELLNNEELYSDSFNKFQVAVELDSNDSDTYNNWGIAIASLARLTNDTHLFEEAFEKYQKAAELGGQSYNLACGYALKKDKTQALVYLENSLENKEQSIEFIKKDEDWQEYLTDPDFINLLEKYS
ncbi:MAG TPA: hypothetical protein VGE24_00530, partial [Emticicia sp.]